MRPIVMLLLAWAAFLTPVWLRLTQCAWMYWTAQPAIYVADVCR